LEIINTSASCLKAKVRIRALYLFWGN